LQAQQEPHKWQLPGYPSAVLTLPYGVDATQLDQCVTQVGSGPQLPAVVAQLKPSGTTATRLFLPWLVAAPMPLPLPVPHACGDPGPARYLSAHVKRRHGPASTVRCTSECRSQPMCFLPPYAKGGIYHGRVWTAGKPHPIPRCMHAFSVKKHTRARTAASAHVAYLHPLVPAVRS
jgi:hypothetical protein